MGIEPVVELDQLNRYLHHLNELRRLNEGDDTADSPGYSLNLIRIPVSVLPGRRTRMGYGAEVEFTIEPHYGRELLPIAFRDFVINGVKNRIAFQVFDIATTEDIAALREALLGYYSDNDDVGPKGASLFALYKHVASLKRLSDFPTEFAVLADLPSEKQLKTAKSIYIELAKAAWRASELNAEVDVARLSELGALVWERATADADQKLRVAKADYDKALLESTAADTVWQNAATAAGQDVAALSELNVSEELRPQYMARKSKRMVEAKRKILYERFADAAKQNYQFAARLLDLPKELSPSYRPTVDYTSLAPSFTTSVNGHTLQAIAEHVYSQLTRPALGDTAIAESDRIDNGLTYPATEEVLLSELRAAYAFLSQINARGLWLDFCTTELADRIHEHRRALPDAQRAIAVGSGADLSRGIAEFRGQFFERIAQDFPEAKGSVVASLAWQIIAESALLNRRLIRDIKETASARNCDCLCAESMDFTGPEPSEEARQIFADYVKCRWPVHVFSLDPITQDQNVADAFSRRREMQVVLALAASNRLLGAQSLTQYARRLEYDLETIALNRTAVGFSHGNNTFGWRFYPRIQAPPVPGHITASVTEMLGYGQDSDARLKQSKLEAGMRECTALIVMPSFLPQVTVDVKSNWFPLGGKKLRCSTSVSRAIAIQWP